MPLVNVIVGGLIQSISFIHPVHVADVFFHICLLSKTIDALDQWEDLTDLGKYIDS